MNIEDLSKSQLLLLTVLVNFVTAIATAVLTVSLLAETPTTVVQTVNRIVDHTIETVTQVPVIASQPDDVPSSEELLVAAISGNAARAVSLYHDEDKRDSAGRALFLPAARAVVLVGDGPTRLYAEFPDGTFVEAGRSERTDRLTLYTFSADAALPQVTSAALITSSEIRQGQTVIALSSDRRATTGIVAKVEGTTVFTDLPNIPVGAEVVNLEGGVVGISLGDGTLLSTEAIAGMLAEPAP